MQLPQSEVLQSKMELEARRGFQISRPNHLPSEEDPCIQTDGGDRPTLSGSQQQYSSPVEQLQALAWFDGLLPPAAAQSTLLFHPQRRPTIMVPNQLSGFPSGDSRRRRTTIKSRAPTSCWRRLRTVSLGRSSIINPKRKSHRRHSDWSNIHFDVLHRALKKLPFADTLQCRAVCSRWRSVTQTHISPHPAAHPPLLIPRQFRPQFLDHPAMLPANDLHPLNRQAKKLFKPFKSVFVGYSHGWFLFLHERKKDCLCLFHPWLFSGTTVCFPPILTPKGFPPILALTRVSVIPEKVVFWADPILSNGNYGIAILHGLYNRILFAMSGATQITDLDYHTDCEQGPDTEWIDIICFRDCIYAVGHTRDGRRRLAGWCCSRVYESPVKVLDIHSELDLHNKLGLHYRRRILSYLVESQGELLIVCIRGPNMGPVISLSDSGRGGGTRGLFVSARSPDTIRVYKLDFWKMKLVQIDSLGDRVLFIMKHQNHSVSSHEFPQYKGNTVYFSHEIVIHGMQSRCIGVFNMEDGSTQEIFPEEP